MATVVAKSMRRDPADLPSAPERLLETPTYEGFPIHALYTALDARPEQPLPGSWPFVRGGDALRDVNTGWKVAESFPVSEDVGNANGAGEERAIEFDDRLLVQASAQAASPRRAVRSDPWLLPLVSPPIPLAVPRRLCPHTTPDGGTIGAGPKLD